MAVSAKWYTNGLKPFLMGAITWKTTGGSTIKVALCTSSYTPNQDTHVNFSDITNEVTGTGYTAGGATMAPTDPTVDTASNETRMDAADVSWASSTITARYAIIYYSTGTAGTSTLLGYVDFGADVSDTSSTFTITWDATGVLKITAA